MPEARAIWTSGKQFVAESGSGHAFVLDASPEIEGRNTGPSPVELVLVALAGCTGIDVVFILRDRMKKPLTGLSVEVTGKRAEEPPKVYTEIEVTYHLRGPGLLEKDAVRAIRLSAKSFCSVSAMLEKTARIRSHFEILDEQSGQTVHGTLADD
jgi:putative redox protein